MEEAQVPLESRRVDVGAGVEPRRVVDLAIDRRGHRGGRVRAPPVPGGVGDHDGARALDAVGGVAAQIVAVGRDDRRVRRGIPVRDASRVAVEVVLGDRDVRSATEVVRCEDARGRRAVDESNAEAVGHRVPVDGAHRAAAELDPVVEPVSRALPGVRALLDECARHHDGRRRASHVDADARDVRQSAAPDRDVRHRHDAAAVVGASKTHREVRDVPDLAILDEPGVARRAEADRVLDGTADVASAVKGQLLEGHAGRRDEEPGAGIIGGGAARGARVAASRDQRDARARSLEGDARLADRDLRGFDVAALRDLDGPAGAHGVVAIRNVCERVAADGLPRTTDAVGVGAQRQAGPVIVHPHRGRSRDVDADEDVEEGRHGVSGRVHRLDRHGRPTGRVVVSAGAAAARRRNRSVAVVGGRDRRGDVEEVRRAGRREEEDRPRGVRERRGLLIRHGDLEVAGGGVGRRGRVRRRELEVVDAGSEARRQRRPAGLGDGGHCAVVRHDGRVRERPRADTRLGREGLGRRGAVREHGRDDVRDKRGQSAVFGEDSGPAGVGHREAIGSGVSVGRRRDREARRASTRHDDVGSATRRRLPVGDGPRAASGDLRPLDRRGRVAGVGAREARACAGADGRARRVGENLCRLLHVEEGVGRVRRRQRRRIRDRAVVVPLIAQSDRADRVARRRREADVHTVLRPLVHVRRRASAHEDREPDRLAGAPLHGAVRHYVDRGSLGHHGRGEGNEAKEHHHRGRGAADRELVDRRGGRERGVATR